jgi:hypothetical protein
MSQVLFWSSAYYSSPWKSEDVSFVSMFFSVFAFALCIRVTMAVKTMWKRKRIDEADIKGSGPDKVLKGTVSIGKDIKELDNGDSDGASIVDTHLDP